MNDSPPTKSSRKFAAGAGLIAAGAIAGGLLANSLAADATTSTPSPAAAGSSSYSQGPHGGPGRGGALDLSGTVTAVNADSDGTTGSVTIKTASGTTTYTVSSDSDIDKNGESQLSKLAAGDAVRFSATGTTIQILHAGSESLDRPHGPGPSGSA
jgi:hypothetical protein